MLWRGDRGVDDHIVTISGNTGVFTQISSSAVWQDAINKGFISAGDEKFRNLTNTGGLTWTGQERTVSWNSSAPNVATGVEWSNFTITLNSNAQSFVINSPGTQDPIMTYTRR